VWLVYSLCLSGGGGTYRQLKEEKDILQADRVRRLASL